VIDLEIPVLETGRLRLREKRLADFPAFCELWRDPNVTRYVCGKPRTQEESWAAFLRMCGHWAVMGYGYWVVEEKASGEVIGEVGFGDFKRDITPSIKGEPEAGWVLATSAHGKGFATEAARAAIAWGDAHFNGARMSCIIDPRHTASFTVAGKCGFTQTARTTYRGDDIVLLHRG